MLRRLLRLVLRLMLRALLRVALLNLLRWHSRNPITSIGKVING